ncbi:MAG TPA: radical SAM protein [Gemmatimonadales bacterium]|nr:radical SAM protein [Gemmatimonadales bacterium]
MPAHRPARFVYDRAPLRVYWELTRACDLACRHCRALAVCHRDPAELTTAESVLVLERLTGFGDPLPKIVFTGGDPLKRPDLLFLIRRARQLGFGVSLAPSGTPLLTGDAVRVMKQAQVEAISLSLDGSTPERHDAFRGVPGTFRRTIEAARVAREVGLPFQVNTLVARATLDDLPAVHARVAELGAARWSLFFLVSVGRGTVLEPITPFEAEELLHWAAGLGRRGGPVVTTTEAPFFRRVSLELGLRGGHGAGIRDGNGVMFISHTGTIHPSGFLELAAGSARAEDSVTIYRESPLFQSLRRPEEFRGRCGRCEFRYVCGGSRARAFAATGDPLHEDPLCPYEPSAVATVGLEPAAR